MTPNERRKKAAKTWLTSTIYRAVNAYGRYAAMPITVTSTTRRNRSRRRV